MHLRLKLTGLRYFLPTFSLLIGLLLTGIIIASSGQARPSIAASVPSNVANVPGQGKSLMFGVDLTDQNTPESVESLLGHKLNLVGWFTHWDKPLVNSKLTYACDNGYVPVITWESWATGGSQNTPWPLKDIAAGKFDSKIKDDLKLLNKTCRAQTVIIRFDHEMNKDHALDSWYPWQGDPNLYVAAWKHVVNLGRDNAQHVKWLWSVNSNTAEATNPYYPGDTYVDYVGITLNQSTYDVDKPQSFAKLYEQNSALLEWHNKPVMISETASAEGASAGRKADWVTGIFNYAERHKKIVGLVWFNEVRKRPDLSPQEQNGFLINSSPTTLNAFKESVAKLYEEQK